MKIWLNNILIYILAIIAVISINFNIGLDVFNTERFGEVSVIYVILFIFMVYLLKKVFRIKEKRIVIVSFIVSVILSAIEILGCSLGNNEIVVIPKSAIIKFGGYIILFYTAIVLLFRRIDFILKSKVQKSEDIKKYNVKSFILVWLSIFILWLPYFIKYYPGVMTTDSIFQTGQAIAYGLNSHHPMFHTLVIKLCLTVGEKIHDYNLGVAIYSIIQMLIMSGIFSYTIYYMKKRNVSRTIAIISFLFFSFYPVFPMYSITMWKDVLFGGMVLLYIINIIELIHDTEKYFSSWKNIVKFVIITLLLMLFRNNGVYAIILSVPIMIIIFRRNYKKILIMYLVPIILYYAFNTFAYNVLLATKGNIAEALSVPMQQIARVVKYNNDKLTEDEKKEINKYMPINKVGEVYDSRISDPVKNLFKSEKLKENKTEFIKLWWNLFLKYPREYIESFLYNSYGYWYPDTCNWIYATDIAENDFGIKQIRNVNVPLLDNFIKIRNIPVISMIFSVGFAFWIAFIIVIYLFYKRKYKYIVAFVTMIALWFTTLASPVYCEYRYVFSIFTCIPIFISILEISNEKYDG